jgi:hypothetical protein
MGWKGKHNRDWVYLDDGYNSEYEVHQNIKSNTYGVFGIVGYDNEWMVFWRPNRNCTTSYYTKLMTEKVESPHSYSGYSTEAVVYATEQDAVDAVESRWQENFVHPEKRKRYRPRDSQKGKVYRWEHIMAFELGAKEIINERREVIALERRRDNMHLHMFLNEVCQGLREKKPVLKFRSAGRHSFGGITIQLLPCHCTRLILLHELAHVLHRRWGTTTNGKKHQSHGKEFVGIYAYLLIRFGGIDKTAIIRHAAKHKIQLLLPEQYWNWCEKEKKAA